MRYPSFRILHFIGMSPSGKAPDFDSGIRRSESGHPSQTKIRVRKNADFCLYDSLFIIHHLFAMSRKIRNSAKALIVKDGKMAAIKIRDDEAEWYIMPGGGQETTETLSVAVCREVAEELGIKVSCKELLFVIEGVNGEKIHRVDLVFLCEYICEIPSVSLHIIVLYLN